MYVTFKNNSTSSKMMVVVENKKYTIDPETSVEIFCANERVIFEAQCSVFDELTEAVKELDEEAKASGFKDKILAKLTKKLVEKIPEVLLDTTIKYEVSFTDYENAVVNLHDGFYSVCDSEIAEVFFDTMVVGFVFSRAEAEGEIKVLDAKANNRKKFLKLAKKMLLFVHWGIFLPDLFFFIPEYSIVKFFSSHFYIKRLFSKLYNKTANDRAALLYKKEQKYETERKNKGCLSDLIKVLIVFLILGGVCFWALTSEPDVIISEDFSSVTCFDENFVKIHGGLPKDAQDVFLEDYTAYYPLGDNEYDMDNYYCHIYETPDGTRYMWLKDDCTNEENAYKDYEDYENPLVYKSIGEQ